MLAPLSNYWGGGLPPPPIPTPMVNIHATMAVELLWLSSVLEWHETEKKFGNS